MTATLSLDAVQASETLVVVAVVLCSEAGVVGACVSGQADVVAEAVAFVDRLPAASKASTKNV